MDSSSSSVMLGGQRDENGCLGSAGYTWCEKQENCVRPWMLEGEWDDECTTSSSMDSSSSSSEPGASVKKQDDLTKIFFNEDGSLRPCWFWTCMVLSITALLILSFCSIRACRKRKRRQRLQRISAGVQMQV